MAPKPFLSSDQVKNKISSFPPQTSYTVELHFILGKNMNTRFRINLVITGFLLVISIIGIVSAASLAQSWKERPAFDGSFSGLLFSSDGSMVFAGGSQLLVRSWDGDIHWGGRSGTIATMNSEGTRVISALDSGVRVFDKNGEEVWTRILGSSPIRAVAVSRDGSLVIGANEEGFIQSWDTNGVRWGLNETDLVKKMAISPSQSLVVAATEAGLKFFSPDMKQIWADDKEGTLDSFIAFSADSRTVITSGDKRVWSHTSSGELNWMREVTQRGITDMACSEDITTIVLGRKDGDVLVLDKMGQERWKYPADSWINGVGVSSDGSIIAAGALDGTLYILDRDGNLLAKTKTDTLIQQGSVQVSRDGKHIIVADEGSLYGFDLKGQPEVISTETQVPITEVPSNCPTCPTCPTPVPVKTTLPTTVSSLIGTTTPVTSGTPASSLDPCLAFVASAGVLYLVIKRKN
jgi:WD40 repeat protein